MPHRICFLSLPPSLTVTRINVSPATRRTIQECVCIHLNQGRDAKLKIEMVSFEISKSNVGLKLVSPFEFPVG